MKMKRIRSGNPLGYKLSLPQVLVCCTLFFMAGFYGSNTFFQVSYPDARQPICRVLTKFSENGCLLSHKTSSQSGVCFMIIAFRTLKMCLRSIFILVVHVET